MSVFIKLAPNVEKQIADLENEQRSERKTPHRIPVCRTRRASLGSIWWAQPPAVYVHRCRKTIVVSSWESETRDQDYEWTKKKGPVFPHFFVAKYNNYGLKLNHEPVFMKFNFTTSNHFPQLF